MLSRRLMLRNIKRLYYYARMDPVDIELRGWNWDKQPIKPRAYLGLGVYEIANKYCPTRRDIWLRRKLGVKPKTTEPMSIGKTIHEVFNTAIRQVNKLVAQGYPGWLVYEELMYKAKKLLNTGNEKWPIELFKTIVLGLAAEIEYEKAVSGGTPLLTWYSEYHVDGSLLGLSSSLSIDALSDGGVVVEIKYGSPREFHKLSITGYALALESNLEIPFDYGLILYVNGVPMNSPSIKVKPVYISNSLRRWFLEERDEIIDMLLEDKEPVKATPCPKQCPFYEVCNS